MRILRALCDALFIPPTQQNWVRDRKIFALISGLRADAWKILLQVHTRSVAMQFYTEKMFNKNIEIGFQSAVFHLSASVRAIIAKW